MNLYAVINSIPCHQIIRNNPTCFHYSTAHISGCIRHSTYSHYSCQMTAGPFRKCAEPPPSGQPTPGISPVPLAGGLHSNVGDLCFDWDSVGIVLDYPQRLDSPLSTHRLPSWMDLSLWILATSFLSSDGSSCHAASMMYPKLPSSTGV